DREAVASKPSGEDALIKRRSNNEGEAAAKRITTILAGETNVPTSSGFIPTTGPPATIIRLGGSSACYQFLVDLLRQLYREDLNQLWALVKEYLSIRPASKWKLYDLSRVHHVIAKDKEIFMLVEKDYPLRRGLALVMISYRLQVKNHSQMAEDLIRKIYNIANTPRKQND
nr:hypothetical protein [Tanacetum cinerariifolium]